MLSTSRPNQSNRENLSKYRSLESNMFNKTKDSLQNLLSLKVTCKLIKSLHLRANLQFSSLYPIMLLALYFHISLNMVSMQ